LAGTVQLYVSKAVLAEYALVLPRPRLKLEPQEIAKALRELRQASTLVNPAFTLCVSRHEPDNRFLECAEAAGADYLVTGNTKHFPPHHKTTQIVNARELLELVAPGRSR